MPTTTTTPDNELAERAAPAAETEVRERPRGWLYLGDEIAERAWRTKRFALGFLLLAISAAFYYELTPVDGIVLCPLRATTGMECAGCGMTRSWIAIADGHLHQALALNPFGPVYLFLAVCKVGFLAVEVPTRRHVVWPLWDRIRVPVLGVIAAAMIVFGIYRAVLFFTS